MDGVGVDHVCWVGRVVLEMIGEFLGVVEDLLEGAGHEGKLAVAGNVRCRRHASPNRLVSRVANLVA
jgi:hypothetical protein